MKKIMALALVCAFLPGCLSAQPQDQDRAGEQRIRQAQQNRMFDSRRDAEKAVTINVTMTGENATLNYEPQSIDIDGGVEQGGNQSGQGSTDADQGASQETPQTQEIPIETSVEGLPTGG